MRGLAVLIGKDKALVLVIAKKIAVSFGTCTNTDYSNAKNSWMVYTTIRKWSLKKYKLEKV